MSDLLDTCILIDYLNGVRQAEFELSQRPLANISRVTWMEVMVGATPSTDKQLRRFLATFSTIELTPAIAGRAVSIRQQRKIKLPDAIILATALETKGLLITRNTRDFPEGSEGVLIPYQL